MFNILHKIINCFKGKSSNLQLPLLIVVLLTGILLRYFYFQEIRNKPDFESPLMDAQFHDYWARALVTGNWAPPRDCSDPEIQKQPFFRPPGYPYFLAFIYLLSGKSYIVIRIVQMMIGILTCILGYILARAIWGDFTGLIFTGLMCTCWAFLYFEGELMATILQVFLLVSLFNVLRFWCNGFGWGRSFAAGIIFGLFALVLPNVLLFFPVVLLWAWWLTKRHRDGPRLLVPLVLFTLGSVISIAPATIRNYIVSHDFVLITSNAGVNLYAGNNETTDGIWPGIPILEELTGKDDWSCFDYPQIIRGVEKLTGKKMKPSEVSDFFTEKAMEFIIKNPVKIIELTLKKTLYFWGPWEISNNKVDYFEKKYSRVLNHLPGFSFFLSLGMCGILLISIYFFKEKQGNSSFIIPGNQSIQFEMTVLMVSFIGAYFVSYIPFFVASRYRVTIMPFLLLFAACGIYIFGNLAIKRKWGAFSLTFLIWIILYLFVRTPFLPYTPDEARWHRDRAGAYYAVDNYKAAAVEFRKALEIEPNAAQARSNYAAVLFKTGNIREAIEQCRQAVKLEPAQARLQLNLASSLFADGQLEESLIYYRNALKLQPDLSAARNQIMRLLYNLANYYNDHGQIRKAAGFWKEMLEYNPDEVEILYRLSLTLSVHPDSSFHDPERAYSLALHACNLTQNNQPDPLDALAAAKAAKCDFPGAITTATLALNLADQLKRYDLAAAIKNRIKLYSSGKSFQDSPLKHQ